MTRLKLSLALVVSLWVGLAPAAIAATNEYAEGVSLYNQKNYRAATTKFEAAMKTGRANPNLYYYCALSNQLSNNRPRAKQLFEYVVNSFPSSPVASMASTALRQMQGGGSSSSAGSSESGGAGVSSYGGAASAGSEDPEMASVPSEVRIPFERHGAGVYVNTQVNGRTIRMHLDTGAPMCLIGANQMQDMGITSTATGQKYKTGGVGDRTDVKGWDAHVDLKVGPIFRKNFPVTVQDHLDGDPLLGQTFFQNFYVSVDDDSRTVTFRKKGSASLAAVTGRDSYSVPFRQSAGGHMLVNAEINGKPYVMIFDTGADGIAMTHKDLKNLRLEMPADAREGVSMGVAGETKTMHFTVDKIKLGPIVKENIEVGVLERSDMDHPLLGQSFFSEYQYTIDNEHHLIKFKPPR